MVSEQYAGTVPVTKIQRFSTHDGPGVRTTVFFKGCPLRCRWCHNPETQSATMQVYYTEKFCIGCGACASVCPVGAHIFSDGAHRFDASRCRGCLGCAQVCPSMACEACARPMTVPEILAEVERDRPFFGQRGGITLSGGEPMFHSEAALTLLEEAKVRGLHTAVETCGVFDDRYVARLTACADLLLWDFKDSDPARHQAYTGGSNEGVVARLRQVDALGGRSRLRCIMVRGVNMERAHYEAIAELYHGLRHCEGVDLLPYHPFGASKAKQLGRQEEQHTEWMPTQEALRDAAALLRERGVPTAM